MEKRTYFNVISMFLAGLLMGAICRCFDLYTQLLGDMFSHMSVWILIGCFIVYHSASRKRSMLNIFVFSIGMLITYYLVAIISHGVYSNTYILLWTVFALCTPVAAFFCWYSRNNDFFGCLVRIGIIITSLITAIFLFDSSWYDFVITALLALYLWKVKD